MALTISESLSHKGITLNSYYIRVDVSLLKVGDTLTFEGVRYADKAAFQADPRNNNIGSAFKVSVPYTVSNGDYILHALHTLLVDVIRRDIAWKAKTDDTPDPPNDPIPGTEWVNDHGILDHTNITISDVDVPV